MSMTAQQAQAVLDRLLEAAAEFDGASEMTYREGNAQRSIKYTSMKELDEAIDTWTRRVASLKRIAAGGPRHDFAVADFR